MQTNEILAGDHAADSYTGDGADVTNLTRINIAAGVPNHILVNDGTGLVSSVASLGISRGGTGLTAVPTNGQLLIGNGTGYTLASLTSDGTVIITPGPGSIHLSAPGGGGGSGFPRCAVSGDRWRVMDADTSVITSFVWRAGMWAGATLRVVSFWLHLANRNCTMEVRDALGVLRGQFAIVVGDPAGMRNFNITAPAGDSLLTFSMVGSAAPSGDTQLEGLFIEGS